MNEELIKCLIMLTYTAWTIHGMYRKMIPKGCAA